MSEDLLAEIQHRLTKQRVKFSDVEYLISELRAEIAKVAELRDVLGYIQSMECYGQISLDSDCKKKIGKALSN